MFKKILSNQFFLRLWYHNLKAWFYAFYYRFPSSKMYVVAVTGTNGKTSSCNLLYQAYLKAGVRVSMLSTVNYAILDQVYLNKNKMSSLQPKKLNFLLSQMREANTEVLIVEATSHAASQGRLNGIKFDQLIFTNLGEDHLEYHGSMENYRQAKIKFLNYLKPNGSFIFNADDKVSSLFLKNSKVQNLGFGENASADLRLTNFDLTLKSSSFTVDYKNEVFDINTNLLGYYNILNVLSVFLSLKTFYSANEDFNISSFISIASQLTPVPGRLDCVFDSKRNLNFVFDYAHDTSALRGLLNFVTEYKENRIFVLFGCVGGGRDKAKRPLMGSVASEIADYVILTNDDPYFDDQQEIIEDIFTGISDENRYKVTKIVDRKEAIEYAFSQLESGDTLVLAGKGGEVVTVINDKIIPFDEKQIVLDLIQSNAN